MTGEWADNSSNIKTILPTNDLVSGAWGMQLIILILNGYNLLWLVCSIKYSGQERHKDVKMFREDWI